MYGTSEPSKPTAPIKTQELRGENLNKMVQDILFSYPGYLLCCSGQKNKFYYGYYYSIEYAAMVKKTFSCH